MSAACSRCGGSGVEPVEQLTLDESLPDRLSAASLAATLDQVTLDAAFDEFWVTYGRVGPRKVARERWLAAVKKGADPADILAGLRLWVRYWDSPGSAKIKWPQGWLNERRWEDAPPAVRAERRAMPGRSGIAAALSNRRAPVGELDQRREIGAGS
jgi:hypothetical protein